MIVRFYTCPKCGGKGRCKGKNFRTVYVCEDCGHTSGSMWYKRVVYIAGETAISVDAENIKISRQAVAN